MDLSPFLPFLASSFLGMLIGSVLALVPALHAYNVAGIVLLLWNKYPGYLSDEQLAYFFMGLVVGYSFLNTVPAVFFSAPDEGTAFALLPAQQYLRSGRGFTAAFLMTLGAAGGLIVLALLAPWLGALLAPLRVLISPHIPWILGCIMLYLVLSEWPFSNGAGSELARFRKAWGQLLAGLTTFLLSGVVGFVLLYRSPLPATQAYQNLLPAFMGFFALPALLQVVFFGERPPKQTIPTEIPTTWTLLAQGISAGALGGIFAAFLPLVTAGMGGLLAGHATAQRDERAFLISQGTSKTIYYVGSFLFFFVPGLQLTRGGLGTMLQTIYRVSSPDQYWVALACMLFSGFGAFWIFWWAARGSAYIAPRVNPRWFSAIVVLGMLGILFALMGWAGLGVAAVCTAIGSIPLYWKSRRMHCLGCITIPITLNMAGMGEPIARILGLG